jgi:osmotically-inducible protein OsmY
MRRLGVGMAIFSIALVAVSWAVADDTDIAREVTRKLKNEKDSGRLQGFDINLQVAEGTVVLKGFVASKEQQELALRAARQSEGVKQVVNELQVQRQVSEQDCETADAIAQELSKQKAAGQLKGFRIAIDVVDGIATLDGVVATEQQKKLARDITAGVSGVNGIVDKMTIQPTEVAAVPAIAEKPVITDAEIARQITGNLKKHQDRGELQGFAIDLSVERGVVKYDGHVSSERQIALALESAQRVAGVRDIVSNLAVMNESAPVSEPIASPEPIQEPSKPSLAETMPNRRASEQPAIPQLDPQPVPVAAIEPSRAPNQAAPPAPVAPARVENALYQSEAEDIAKLDKQIGTELMKQLQDAKQNGQLRGFGIGVHVQNAEVKLSGRVSSKEQHQMAIDIARHIRGVKRVINDLTISEPDDTSIAAQTTPEAGETNDAESLRIAQQLGFQIQQQEAMGRLAGCDFDLRVDRAAVIMSGRVAAPQQERLLLELARQTPGVRQVSANLTVSPELANGMVPVSPVAVQMPPQGMYGMPMMANQVPVAYSNGPMMAGPVAMADQTPRPMGAARMAAYAGGAVIAAPMLAMNQLGGGAPAQLPGAGHAVVPARYDQPNLPGYAWPSYAAHPNYAAVTYPKQYSPTAWPYIGPFYPYPQVPLGWRKVTLKWDDGWWQLNFKSK